MASHANSVQYESDAANATGSDALEALQVILEMPGGLSAPQIILAQVPPAVSELPQSPPPPPNTPVTSPCSTPKLSPKCRKEKKHKDNKETSGES